MCNLHRTGMTMGLTGRGLLLVYIPVDDDSTVTVPHIDGVLSAEQKAGLDT